MKAIRISVSTLAICAAVALPLLAAEKLGAKTGLWETTTTINMGAAMPAMPALPPEMLANLPPAQRAQIEKMMNTAAGKPTTARSCITEKDLQQGAFQQQQQQDMKCKYTTISSTPKRQESTFQCTSPNGAADGKLAVDVVSDGHVKGTMQIKAQQMTIESKFESKWLGADCGTTK
jgi:hypothetical protein